MPSQSQKYLYGLLLGGLIAVPAQAVVYPLPPPDVDVIGEVKVIYAGKEDTFLDIARANGLGYNEIVQANPGIDRWTPGQGTPIVLPTRYILPDAPREGIVLNVAEMRLYYYPPAGAGGERVVHTYPVSIGRMDWKTPLGLAKVTAKETDPVWRPPASIKAEHAADGDILPDVVPSGPDNPLGRHAMRLSIPGYLIHGTDKPYGIGMRVTHGCVRMYPEDVEHLYGMVPVGMSVRLVDQPVKVGRIGGQLLLEAHAPLEEEEIPIKVTIEQAHQVVAKKIGPDLPGVDQSAMDLVVEQFSGIPVAISGGDGNGAVAQPTYPAAPPAAVDTTIRRSSTYSPTTAYNSSTPVYPRPPVLTTPPGAASSYNRQDMPAQPVYRPSAPAVRPGPYAYSTPGTPSAAPVIADTPAVRGTPVPLPYPSTSYGNGVSAPPQPSIAPPRLPYSSATPPPVDRPAIRSSSRAAPEPPQLQSQPRQM